MASVAPAASGAHGVHGVPARRQDAAPEGCLAVAIRIPVRIVVLVLVLPVRMVWDALVVGGRFLKDTLFRPLGRAFMWVFAPVGRAACGWSRGSRPSSRGC
jgi:hypothetical protein